MLDVHIFISQKKLGTLDVASETLKTPIDSTAICTNLILQLLCAYLFYIALYSPILPRPSHLIDDPGLGFHFNAEIHSPSTSSSVLNCQRSPL